MKLKPCPCCGSRDVALERWTNSSGDGSVECKKCGLNTEIWHYKTAVKKWNRRQE
jgi:Lar family restriction alleviation protein